MQKQIDKPRIKCYDNGGKTCDRYTVVYMDQISGMIFGEYLHEAVAMSECPYHPQGFCQHTGATVGPHLGKEIKFADLPADCREVVQNDLAQNIS